MGETLFAKSWGVPQPYYVRGRREQSRRLAMTRERGGRGKNEACFFLGSNLSGSCNHGWMDAMCFRGLK